MTSSVFTPGTKVRTISGPLPGRLGEILPCVGNNRDGCHLGMVHWRPDNATNPQCSLLMFPSELEPLS